MSFEKQLLTTPERSRPILYLFCGLPGSGKTTLARQIEAETGAIRICPDEWMADLSVDLFDESFRDKLEKKLWKLCEELLCHGQDVILENGLWMRSERDEKRKQAKTLGVTEEMHYMDVPLEELLRRLEIRNVSGGHGTVPISREQQESYAKLFQAPDEAELALFTKAVVHKPV